MLLFGLPSIFSLLLDFHFFVYIKTNLISFPSEMYDLLRKTTEERGGEVINNRVGVFQNYSKRGKG